MAFASWLRVWEALGTFLVVTAIGSTPASHRWDESISDWLEQAAPPLHGPARLLVHLANAEVMIPVVALAAVVTMARDRRRGIDGVWLAAGLLVASVVAVTLRSLIVHPGPAGVSPHHASTAWAGVSTPNSFPSGHTVRTTLLAGTLFPRARWLMAVAILGMMTALVYQGEHWPSDVLGGLALGWVALEIKGVLTRVRSQSTRGG